VRKAGGGRADDRVEYYRTRETQKYRIAIVDNWYRIGEGTRMNGWDIVDLFSDLGPSPLTASFCFGVWLTDVEPYENQNLTAQLHLTHTD
jgi:hypothetical protein